MPVPGPARAGIWTEADSLRATHAGDQFGDAVAGLGDVTGDGFADLGVGAHYFTNGTDTAAGIVDVFTGGMPPGSPPVLRLYGMSPHEHFGESLAGARDINGDGRPDLVVGAPLRDQGPLRAPGGVDVFLGGPGLSNSRWASLAGEAADDWLGQSLALGDVDGDGFADIIAGAPYNDRGGSAAGAVFIYRGGASAPTTAWKVLVGEAANDQFGWSVAYLGDVNGDGYGDIAVGARLHSVIGKLNAGRVYLFLGGPAMDAVADGGWNGEAASDWFGAAVAAPGDVDGGGRPDLLVGAPYNDRGGSASGAAYLFRGELPAGSPPAAVFAGQSANAQLGFAVGGTGDLTGDGLPDLVVGARFQASGLLAAAGRVYVHAGGAAVSPVPWATADGKAADDWFGYSVGGITGYFGGGRGDAVSGAPLNDQSQADGGSAYVFGVRPSLAIPPGPTPARTLSVSPMPASGDVRITGLLGPSPAPGAAQSTGVVVQDLLGRVVGAWQGPTVGSGAFDWAWDARDARGQRVPPGLYLVRVSTSSGATARARIVIAR